MNKKFWHWKRVLLWVAGIAALVVNYFIWKSIIINLFCSH